MLRKVMLALVIALLAASAYGQAAGTASPVGISLALLQRSALPAEPLHAVITIRNQSGQALKLSFEPRGDVLGPWSDVPALLLSSGGGTKPAYCIQTAHTMMADFAVHAEDGGYWTPPGKSIQFDVVFDLPKPDGVQPGSYVVTAHYEAPGRHLGQEGGIVGQPNDAYYVCNQCWAGTVDSSPVQLTVEAPTGVDAAAYQAFKGDPLAHPADLLKRFPTSTYAGYALRERIPALAREALADLNDPDGTLYRWGNLGGGEATIHLHIIEAQKDMEGFAAAAQAFLRAHPDFIYAAEIRRGYAMCLGLTGHLPEAMSEIQTLSTGTGKEADEAKAFLGEKTPTKPAKEGGYQP